MATMAPSVNCTQNVIFCVPCKLLYKHHRNIFAKMVNLGRNQCFNSRIQDIFINFALGVHKIPIPPVFKVAPWYPLQKRGYFEHSGPTLCTGCDTSSGAAGGILEHVLRLIKAYLAIVCYLQPIRASRGPKMYSWGQQGAPKIAPLRGRGQNWENFESSQKRLKQHHQRHFQIQTFIITFRLIQQIPMSKKICFLLHQNQFSDSKVSKDQSSV